MEQGVELGGARGIVESKIGMCLANALKREGECLAPKSSGMNALGPEGNLLRLSVMSDLNKYGISLSAFETTAANMKRDGNLVGANGAYATYCICEEPYSKSYIWPWMKVFFLAKNFENAALLLTYLHAYNVCYNNLRLQDGESLSDYAAWGSTPPTSHADYDPWQYLAQVSGRDLSSREKLEQAIRDYGGSDYWQKNYHLTEAEYNDFLRCFKPTAKKQVTSQPESSTSGSSSGGCYIATSVYGTYDCPELWRFRRFRDEVLAQSSAGRLFIRAYYAISPKLVRGLGGNERFSHTMRKWLDRFANMLGSKGLSDLPYSDKDIGI